MNTEWSLKITKVSNGFVLEGNCEEDEAGLPISDKTVIEEDEGCGELSEHFLFRDMLNAVKDYFGCYYTKHSKDNVIVRIESEKDE